MVLLDEGRIVAEGTHEQLLQTNSRYREVLARAAAADAGEDVAAVTGRAVLTAESSRKGA